MDNNWRFAAKSVSKYDPIYRDKNGHYKHEDWVGFFQIGKSFNGKKFTIEEYLTVEQQYISAGKMFFEYHNCEEIILKNTEFGDFSNYHYQDRSTLLLCGERIRRGSTITMLDLENVMKLILRELMWSEIFCKDSKVVALRFGYDLYMYLNSDRDIKPLLNKIQTLGLFID